MTANHLRDFVWHDVDKGVSFRMSLVRQRYHDLAVYVMGDIPDSRERGLALTHLEESLMRAIQALAVAGTVDRNTGDVVHDSWLSY